MRIAIDIDSTLHHYWSVLSDAARRRFGVDLRYDEQYDWAIRRLRPEQLRRCIAETHSDEVILACEPYPGAVETVRGWHEAGHFIQITSHRDELARGATERWLERIGAPYDELHVSYDKIDRCLQSGIELLIDDSPHNLVAAIDHGIVAATIAHPWNRDVREEEDVICGADWHELAARLAPLLAERPAAPTPADL